ncbi:MAG TPA: N-6 DNA methylase [Fimbriimonadaceae bacterium]|nr:N-6 DNA methylase [Fimbriimonadaceae bacterium]
MAITAEHLAAIQTFEDLAGLFARELGWPKDTWATFGGVAKLYGLTDLEEHGVESLAAVQKLSDDQSWGIFLVDFGSNEMKRSALRGILTEVADRARAKHDNPVWPHEKVLFVIRHSCGAFTLGYFRGDKLSNSRLRIFGWTDPNRSRTARTSNLPKLRWEDQQDWHNAWNAEALADDFFEEYRQDFLAIEASVQGVEDAPLKRRFTQTLLNRLLFICFLQEKRWLEYDGVREDYLFRLWETWKPAFVDAERERGFYDRLRVLFFSGLNSLNGLGGDGHIRDLIGRVPFLNGGLFKPDADVDRIQFFVPNESLARLLEPEGLLRRYTFTYTESTPDEIEVAIDPEMLGRVFERLVTSDVRRIQGGFYTPRSIVSFMCKEVLKGYLSDGGIEREKVEALVDDEDASLITVPEAPAVLQRLEAVKVLDPACGSGAFLVGLLQEIFKLQRKLDTRAQQLNARDDHDRKLTIIRNCLYGADIEPFAVNIAMLRLWLSLVVNDEQEPLDDPDADVSLPNLRFKIGIGDSLTAPHPRRSELMVAEPYMLAAHRVRELHEEYFEPDQHRRRSARDIEDDIGDRYEEIDDLLRDSPAPEGAFDWRRDFAEVFAPAIRTGDFQGFDIVIANPPYGEGTVTDATRDALFGPRSGQSKDLYSAFMARAFQLMKPGAWMTYITSNTWRTIRTHRPLRRMLLENATVQHVIDVPEWVFAQPVVRTCVTTLKNNPSPDGHVMIAADLAALPREDWPLLEANLRAVAYHGPDLQTDTFARYSYPQAQVGQDPNAAFFIALPSLQRFFTEAALPRLGEGAAAVATVVQGLATADNNYYLRYAGSGASRYARVNIDLVLTEEQLREFASRPEAERLRGIDPAEFGGRYLVPYDKGGESDLQAGGWLPCFHVPTEYYIDWSRRAVHRLRTATIADIRRDAGEAHRIRPGDADRVASRFQNATYYFRDGITWSVSGRFAPTFRLGSGGVFDVKGSTMFPIVPILPLLGILNSKLCRFLTKAFLNNGWDAQVDDVKRLPIVMPQRIMDRLRDLVTCIIDAQRQDPRYEYWNGEAVRIEELVADAYELSHDEVRDVDLWTCRFERGRLASTRTWLNDARAAYEDHLARCAYVIDQDPRTSRDDALIKLIAKGEGHELEFKQSLVWADPNHRDILRMPEELREQGLQQARVAVTHDALETIVAFLNSDGGTLLIGVHDKGPITGFEVDFPFVGQRQDRDGFEQHLRNLIQGRIQPQAFKQVRIAFLPRGLQTVCQIDVEKGRDIYLYGGQVSIREGNRTRKLTQAEMLQWLPGRRREIGLD